MKKLLDDDEQESESLFQACKDLGFFYLDLRDCSLGQSMLNDAEELFGVGEKLFDEGLDQYDFSARKTYFG